MEKCKHCNGFHLRTDAHELGYPGTFNCNSRCGYFLTFDPDVAGTCRPNVTPGEELDIYSQNFWGNMLVGYTTTPKGDKKTVPLSTGGKY